MEGRGEERKEEEGQGKERRRTPRETGDVGKTGSGHVSRRTDRHPVSHGRHAETAYTSRGLPMWRSSPPQSGQIRTSGSVVRPIHSKHSYIDSDLTSIFGRICRVKRTEHIVRTLKHLIFSCSVQGEGSQRSAERPATVSPGSYRAS